MPVTFFIDLPFTQAIVIFLGKGLLLTTTTGVALCEGDAVAAGLGVEDIAGVGKGKLLSVNCEAIYGVNFS